MFKHGDLVMLPNGEQGRVQSGVASGYVESEAEGDDVVVVLLEDGREKLVPESELLENLQGR